MKNAKQVAQQFIDYLNPLLKEDPESISKLLNTSIDYLKPDTIERLMPIWQDESGKLTMSGLGLLNGLLVQLTGQEKILICAYWSGNDTTIPLFQLKNFKYMRQNE